MPAYRVTMPKADHKRDKAARDEKAKAKTGCDQQDLWQDSHEKPPFPLPERSFCSIMVVSYIILVDPHFHLERRRVLREFPPSEMVEIEHDAKADADGI